jgi:hypothetical protein
VQRVSKRPDWRCTQKAPAPLLARYRALFRTNFRGHGLPDRFACKFYPRQKSSSSSPSSSNEPDEFPGRTGLSKLISNSVRLTPGFASNVRSRKASLVLRPGISECWPRRRPCGVEVSALGTRHTNRTKQSRFDLHPLALGCQLPARSDHHKNHPTQQKSQHSNHEQNAP